MSNSVLGEIYFIAGMMILILILCAGATYAFFKTYYKEKDAQQKARKQDKIENLKTKT